MLQGTFMITRRTFLQGLGGLTIAGAGFIGLGVGEAVGRPVVARYSLSPPGWPQDQSLRIAALSDLHACETWMPPARIRRIVDEANALNPDLVVLLGDYTTHNRRFIRPIAEAAWANELRGLSAPLGVLAVQGNHDMWADADFQIRRTGTTLARRALSKVGIPVLENDAVRLSHGGREVWIAGLADQWAFYAPRRQILEPERSGYRGLDDLAGTLAKVVGDAPVILLAHEPDIFPKVPARVSLTLSGHMHHGQVRVLGYAPAAPSMYGRRYLYGHIVEEGRHLIVSGGLGCSTLPIRVQAPPEIVLVELGQAKATS